MSLPVVACPCCNVQLPMEAWIAHQGAREAFLALAGLHPSMRLPYTTMRYVGLFGPRKQTMRWDRIADLFREVKDLIGTGRVAWKGQDLPAPLDYWLNGMETLLAKDDLRRPLGNHNYLKAVVAGMSEQAAATIEQKRITGGRGETPIGHADAGPGRLPKPVRPETDARTERKAAPVSLADTLKSLNLNPNPNPTGARNGTSNN